MCDVKAKRLVIESQPTSLNNTNFISITLSNQICYYENGSEISNIIGTKSYNGTDTVDVFLTKLSPDTLNSLHYKDKGFTIDTIFLLPHNPAIDNSLESNFTNFTGPIIPVPTDPNFPLPPNPRKGTFGCIPKFESINGNIPKYGNILNSYIFIDIDKHSIDDCRYLNREIFNIDQNSYDKLNNLFHGYNNEFKDPLIEGGIDEFNKNELKLYTNAPVAFLVSNIINPFPFPNRPSQTKSF
jgi:hypothetical protein